jgi:hypothetical protein
MVSFLLMEWGVDMHFVDPSITPDLLCHLSRLTWKSVLKMGADCDHAIPLLPVDWDQKTAG